MTATPDRFLVRPRHHNGTGVLVLHGSSGRLESARAELLAGHGALALALRWFGGAGQPDSPREIPLELFMQAAEILAEECDRVAILGTSFGAEAALLTAAEDPTIDAVVALAPTPYAWAGYSPESGWSSHWTLRGAPVPFISFDPSWTPQATPPAYRSLYQQSADRDVVTAQKASIAVERIEAEVVLVAGGDDQVWPATAWAAEIQSRRRAAGLPTVVITDEQAGHRVVLPGEVAATGGMTMARGGTPTADARLGLKAWPAIAAALRLT